MHIGNNCCFSVLFRITPFIVLAGFPLPSHKYMLDPLRWNRICPHLRYRSLRISALKSSENPIKSYWNKYSIETAFQWIFYFIVTLNTKTNFNNKVFHNMLWHWARKSHSEPMSSPSCPTTSNGRIIWQSLLKCFAHL